MTPAQGKQRQEEFCELKASSVSSLHSEFQASQVYAVRHCLKKIKTKNQPKKKNLRSIVFSLCTCNSPKTKLKRKKQFHYVNSTKNKIIMVPDL